MIYWTLSKFLNVALQKKKSVQGNEKFYATLERKYLQITYLDKEFVPIIYKVLSKLKNKKKMI